jgi:hypothetical protein
MAGNGKRKLEDDRDDGTKEESHLWQEQTIAWERSIWLGESMDVVGADQYRGVRVDEGISWMKDKAGGPDS